MIRIGVVFPGQGAQRAGMAKDFFENFAECREVFTRASAALGRDMTTLCFTECEDLHLTEFTQPALLATEIAMYEALKKHCNFLPHFFAGHSLGEYSALVAAGVIPFEDAIKIVRKRGMLMQQAVPQGEGAMAALVHDSLDIPTCESIIKKEGAEIANYNSPSQIVMSGRKSAVESARTQILKSFPDMKVVMLNVSAPFHCSMMSAIEHEFRGYIEQFKPGMRLDKCTSVLSNFTGEFHQPESLIDMLVRQISGSVKWVANMRALSAVAPRILELGPNRVLGRFFAVLGVEVSSIIDIRSMRRIFPEETTPNELSRA